METPRPTDLVALARTVADDTAAMVASRVDDAHGHDTKSSPTDVVTEVDRAAERRIVTMLLDARPDDGVVGEEGADHAGASGVRWIIDPIDGTTNFFYGLAGFAISIAAEVDGVVVAGAVADPLHRETFTATLGGGAFCNDAPIRVNDHRDLATALVGTGFSYEPDRRRRQADVLRAVIGEVRDIRRLGAASVDLCAVARGRLDGYYEKGLNVWDYAAGALVASEAGAVLGDLDGGPPSSAFTLAAAPRIFEPLRALLRAAGAADA
ncbi:MAG: inositol monophosphatase family protein [Actinomycetota bacterium]|nr:inositol monophosphatase family protein [Actinomycetota bacterium]